ncbi:MAG: mandelate racemase/muconate lactonizing enzyme family protein [Spirochaetales bacterium]|nr:mandelate racemase/muconate lactonizing enzyme family protein [Spirochaetales bacterium]
MMNISSITVYVVPTPPPHYGGTNWIFVKLTTNEGIVGFGEASRNPGSPDTVVKMIEDLGRQYVIGFDPFDIEKLFMNLYGSHRSRHPDLTRFSIISAFEMACWDIIGKALEQPVYNLLGGKFHDKLRAYTYLYPSSKTSVKNREELHINPEQAGIRAAEYVAQGFTAVKFDPLLDLMSSYLPVEAPLDKLVNAEAVVRSVREAVGDKCDILIGTHGQLNTHSAIRFAKRIEPYDPLWFEEPVPPENIDEMARVARSTSIPVATGERLSTKYEFADLVEKQAAAILQPSIGIVGGILEGKKIATMAETHYVQIAPWMYYGPIAGAASIQLDVCSPNFLLQEGIETWGGFTADVLQEPIQWQEGYIIPPTKPGLGVELNEERIRKLPHAYRVDV